VGKPLGKHPFERLRKGREYITMDHREMGCEDEVRRDQRALLFAMLNLGVFLLQFQFHIISELHLRVRDFKHNQGKLIQIGV
jgi:hypothetical protein